MPGVQREPLGTYLSITRANPKAIQLFIYKVSLIQLCDTFVEGVRVMLTLQQ